MLLSCFLFVLKNSSRHCLFFFLSFHGFFRICWHGARWVTTFLKDKCKVTTLVPLFEVDEKYTNDEEEEIEVSKKGGVFGGVWGSDLFHCAS
jgi:hypothetical protein